MTVAAVAGDGTQGETAVGLLRPTWSAGASVSDDVVREFARHFASAFDDALAEAEQKQRAQAIVELVHDTVCGALAERVAKGLPAERYVYSGFTLFEQCIQVQTKLWVYSPNDRVGRIMKGVMQRLSEVPLRGPNHLYVIRRQSIAARSLRPPATPEELEREFGMAPVTPAPCFTHRCTATYLVRLPLSLFPLPAPPGGGQGLSG